MRFFQVAHVVQTRQSVLSLRLHCFYVKAENERCTVKGSCCRQNLKYENFTSSFDRLHKKFVPKSVPHVQHDCFSSFNQSNH